MVLQIQNTHIIEISMKWKNIEGYEGLYLISDNGLVKSLQTNRILKPSGKRYHTLTLCKNKKLKYVRVNRLVAQAFIENPNNYPIVMHKDNDTFNNCVDNLQWGTYSENNNHAYQSGNQEHTKKYNSERLKSLHRQKSKLLKNYA